MADSERNPGEPRPTIVEEQTALTRDRIRRGAMEALARDGLDATVEAVAELARVSPRTVFRYFKTHDQLILQTVTDIFDACGRRVSGIPHSAEDLEGWLIGLSSTIHRRNIEILGQAFWDIHPPRCLSSANLRAVDQLRHDYRTRGVGYLTKVAWRAAGGVGDPPEDLKLAFALNFSAFATHALVSDFDQTPEQIGELTAEILIILLQRAVAFAGDPAE